MKIASVYYNIFSVVSSQFPAGPQSYSTSLPTDNPYTKDKIHDHSMENTRPFYVTFIYLFFVIVLNELSGYVFFIMYLLPT